MGSGQRGCAEPLGEVIALDLSDASPACPESRANHPDTHRNHMAELMHDAPRSAAPWPLLSEADTH